MVPTISRFLLSDVHEMHVVLHDWQAKKWNLEVFDILLTNFDAVERFDSTTILNRQAKLQQSIQDHNYQKKENSRDKISNDDVSTHEISASLFSFSKIICMY